MADSVAAVFALMLAVGCSGSRGRVEDRPIANHVESPTPRPPVDAAATTSDLAAAFAKMEQFRDQMCACKDATCVQGVSDAMTVWAQQMAKDNRADVKVNDADAKRMAEIASKLSDCMSAAITAGPGSGGPTP